MGVRQSTVIRSDRHRQWVKGFECLIAGKLGHVCWGKMDPHHVRKGSHTGMSATPDDCLIVPLCRLAHDEAHRGHDTFERKYKLNLASTAAALWQRSPHRRKASA